MNVFGAAVDWVLGAQRGLQQALAAPIRDMGTDAATTLAALGIAFALGTVHALTPGHGKAVVFSYFVGRRSRVPAGMAMAAKIALMHSASAALLVLLFGAATSSFGRPSGFAALLQTTSYAVIACIGAYYLWRSVCRADEDGWKQANRGIDTAALPFAIGLLPCPLTMLVVSYALMQGLMLNGLILAAVIGAGAALTIGAVGTIGIVLRSGLFRWLDPDARVYRSVLGGLEIASSAAILAVGLVFFAGSIGIPSPEPGL